MINIDYLDCLYTWKVEAEQKLKKIEENENQPVPNKEAEWYLKIRKLEMDNANQLVFAYQNAIKLYLSFHQKIQ